MCLEEDLGKRAPTTTRQSLQSRQLESFRFRRVLIGGTVLWMKLHVMESVILWLEFIVLNVA
jgi:hypothetical protein